MIALATDCLVFEMAGGENIPLSADMVSVELCGVDTRPFDRDFVRDAANAVFHYFRHELGKQAVTIAEFAGALEKVLAGFRRNEMTARRNGVAEADLGRLATESGAGSELFFFPLLRHELRQQMQASPRIVKFHGLRACVKLLLGAQRWTPRCREMQDQIITFLRECVSAEGTKNDMTLVVE